MCDCLDEENEEGKPLTWTYVGQGRGDWAEAKNLEFVGEGKGAFVKDREVKPSIFCRSNVLTCVGCSCLFFLVPVLLWFILFSGAIKFAPPRGQTQIMPQVWSCTSPPSIGAAAAGAAIMEEAWMALDLDMDGFIPKASLGLWTSQNLMSTSAAAYLNATEVVGDMISNDAYIQALLKADANALGDEQWVSGAWLLCDKNQDKKVTKIEMGFLQRHGSLKESIDQQLWSKDADGDGALDRDEFQAGLATVALHGQGAIQALFNEVQTRYWPAAKRGFCCHTQGICGVNVVSPPLAALTTLSTTFAASYDCTTGKDNVEGWTEMRRAWCCSRQSVGCFSTISVPFDCDKGLETWQNSWSTKKQEWCCFNVAKGCGVAESIVGHPPYDHHDHHIHYVDMPAGTAPAYPLPAASMVHVAHPEGQVTHVVHHVQPIPASSKAVFVGERVHVYDVVHKTSHEMVPFDCDAGMANWKVGWSTDKKSWCCDHFGKGCPVPLQAQHPLVYEKKK